MNLIYTGVGSRQAALDAMRRATAYATRLAELGWTMRSGRADGMDKAWERGAGPNAEIYLPERNFGGRGGRGSEWVARTVVPRPTAEAYEMAEQFHPNWKACGQFARDCHARNCHQVLGLTLDLPSRFLACWTPGGRRTGGTAQAMRVADAHDVPVFNIATQDGIDALAAFIKETMATCTTRPT